MHGFNQLHMFGLQFDWYGAGRDDARYLTDWRNATITYDPGQSHDNRYRRDSYRATPGIDPTGRMFATAGDRLLRYQFYPPDVLVHTSDFGLQQRHAQPGDRIVQRIRLFPRPGLPLLDVLTMNEISAVVDEPCRKGISYVTTRQHGEVGLWSAEVTWEPDNRVVLAVRAVARPVRSMPEALHPLLRALQLRAHQRGIQSFIAALTETSAADPSHKGGFAADTGMS
jgi:hypothetical protein